MEEKGHVENERIRKQIKLKEEFDGIPVPDTVPNAWLVTFDSLRYCVKYPQLSEETTELLFRSLNEHLCKNTVVLFPHESNYSNVEELHLAYECYKEFLAGVSNLFFRFLTQELGKLNSENVWNFYNLLLIKLHGSNQALYLYLMEKIIACLNSVLDTYMNNQNNSIPVVINIFDLGKNVHFLRMAFVPIEAFTAFTINSLKNATELAVLCTKIIYSQVNCLQNTELKTMAVNTLCKRFASCHQFGCKELLEFDMLSNISLKNYPELLPVIDELMINIMEDKFTCASNQEELLKLEQKILTVLLASENESIWGQLHMIQNLKSQVLQIPLSGNIHEERNSLRCRVLTHVMRSFPGLVRLAESDLKWLARDFTINTGGFALNILLAYMESEMKLALPLLIAQSNDSPFPSQRFHQRVTKWHDAEKYSAVWVLLKDLLASFLERLDIFQTYNDGVDELKELRILSGKPYSDQYCVSYILKELALISYNLENLQLKTDQTANIFFKFFPEKLEKMVRQILSIPTYCTSFELHSKRSKLCVVLWEQFLDIIHCFRQLPEICQLGQNELSCLDALAGLLWLGDVASEQPSIDQEHLSLMLAYADSLRESLGNWDEKPNDFFDLKNLDSVGCIVASFLSRFHHVKGKITSWRVHILELSLKTQSHAFKAIAIPSVPIVISLCHRDYVPQLLKCLEDLKSETNLDIALLLAQTVPLVVCALSGRCDVVNVCSTTKNASYDHPSIHLKVVCHECDDAQHSNHRGWNLLHLWENFTEIWATLMSHPEFQVRAAIAHGIRRVCKHFGNNLKPLDISRWMELLRDDEIAVSTEIAPHVPLLFTSHCKTETVTLELFEVVYNELKEATFKSVRSRSPEHWEILLDAVNSIMKEPHSFILIPIAKLISLLIAVGNENCHHITQTMVSQLATLHNISPKVLFWHINEEVWKIIVNIMVITPADKRNVTSCLKRFSYIFGVEETILKKQLYRLFIQLIPQCLEDMTLCSLVQDISYYTATTTELIISKWFPLISPVIELEQTPEKAQRSIDLMISWSASSESEALRTSLTLMISRLMCDFDSQQEKVLSIISNIYYRMNGSENSPINEDILRKFLEPHYLGILVSLQNTVLQKYVGDDIKLKALNSLSALIKFMGTQYFSQFHVKTLNSLCTFSCLTNPHLCESLCELVYVFVCHVDHKHLKLIIIIVMTTVMHLDWNTFYVPIKRILDYIFIDMKNSIQQVIIDLSCASDFLRYFGHGDIVNTAQSKFKKLEFLEALHFNANLLSSHHEISQIIGLRALKAFVAENQERLQKFLFGHMKFEDKFKLAFGKLLDNCSSSNPEIRTLSVEIIASIGAIDPKHWALAYGFYFKTRSTVFYIDAICPNFAAAAFDILVQEFQARSNASDINIIAYVCQQLMKALDFQDEAPKAPIEIWDIIEKPIQLAITPFFKSRYDACIDVDESALPHPIFGSTHGTTFESWLFNWVCRLIGMIHNAKAKTAFSALKWIFKMNLPCTKFFLPHIFIYAVWYAPPHDSKMIFEEITAAARLAPRMKAKDITDVAKDLFVSLNLSCSLQNFSSADCNANVSPVQVKASQVVFHLVDYMMRWKLEFECMEQEAKAKLEQENPPCITLSQSSSSNDSDSSSIKPSHICALKYRHTSVSDLLKKMSMVALSESSHLCNENFRALRYLEIHSVQNLESLQLQLNLFLRIYVQLNEEDAVSGVVATMESYSNVAEKILVCELTGQLQDALISYGTLFKNKDEMPQILCNMAKAQLGLGEFHSTLAFAEKYGQSGNLSDNDFMMAIKLEVLWSMGKWELLRLLLDTNKTSRPTFASHIAHILLAMHSGNLGVAKSEVTNMHSKLGCFLYKSSFKSDVYAQFYNIFLFNHITLEMDIMISLLDIHASSLKNVSHSDDTWIQYIQAALEKMAMYERRVSTSWKSFQQLLAMRRILLSILHDVLLLTNPLAAAFVQEQIGDLWIKSAKIAFKHRQFPQALNYTCNADKCNMKEAFVLTSQIEWESGKHDAAIIHLKRGIKSKFQNEYKYKGMPADHKKEERLICAQARLLIAEYSHELKIVNSVDSVRLHKEAVSAYPFCEETWVKYGRAWQILMKDKKESHNDDKHLGMLCEEMKAYSKALSYGIQHIYESLPRCISIWANMGLTLHKQSVKQSSKASRNSTDNKPFVQKYFRQASDIINGLKNKLPLYAFYVCFSQLSSRLCHPDKSVYTTIQNIILLLLQKYPHHMLWKLIPMLKLSHAVRINRVQDILLQYHNKNTAGLRLTQDYLNLIDNLHTFGFSTPKSKFKTQMRHLAPKLPKLLLEENFGPILMPTKEMLTATLPDDDMDFKSHEAFPRKPVFMVEILENVQVIMSLQRPKKFTITGSDHSEYNWLIKTKDDLRIDSLVMDFMQVLNLAMQQDPECKKCELKCQTYSVIPLGEDCGLIEWLPDLVPLRATLNKVYKIMGQKHNMKHDIKKEVEMEIKKVIFEEFWLPSHPPVLGNWFIQQFPDDTSWYAARKRFTYSTALMSMVGYMLGLGDRHGGNIMLNEVTGEAVHVDFNCLFNKGEKLPWPEKVPFRLTHNLVRCMGGTGAEGVFSRTCELVLRLIRQNQNTLLSVLRPILYDASRRDMFRTLEAHEEFFNESMVPSFHRIKLRMRGYVNDSERANSSAETILSPEGHAQAIIKQAMDIKNLCIMYPGWGAFM